jgi:hypothetical protein
MTYDRPFQLTVDTLEKDGRMAAKMPQELVLIQ